MDKFVQVKDQWSKKSQKIPLKGCNVLYYRKAFTIEESKKLFQRLKELNWAQSELILGGELKRANRLTASYSIDGKIGYTYNYTTSVGEMFHPVLFEIKERVDEILDRKYDFNFCFCNYYVNGEHSIAFHSDSEPKLRFPIASVSFGAARKFKFRSKTKGLTETVVLEDGSLLLMDEESQKNYLHGIDKEKNAGPRINLTFRIMDAGSKSYPQFPEQEGSKRIKVDQDTYIPVNNEKKLEESVGENSTKTIEEPDKLGEKSKTIE